MILWRISNHATLDGQGGLMAAARWHTQGNRIVYLASNPASALLEILVHLEVTEEALPERFQLLKIGCPDSVSIARVDAGTLPKNWASDARVTRAIGDRWLAERRSALLSIPSAIVPETENWLLNPLHADAGRLKIEWSGRFPYDGRLFRSTRG